LGVFEPEIRDSIILNCELLCNEKTLWPKLRSPSDRGMYLSQLGDAVPQTP
jgi:hypothetical protein